MEAVGGIPIECLTGELAGVWSGWRTLGDREVVRESSAKGTHINLAQKCLATRRNCSLAEAQSYFYREVDVWVEELLVKHQVFRATHIIKNVGKDPKERINSICINSKDPVLRNYLVQHLRKIDGLRENQVKAWEIIQFSEDYKIKYFVQHDPISSRSIEEIIQIPQDVKTVLYTDLYFHTFDPRIADDLSSEVAWDYLLMTNRLDFLCIWIDVNYGTSDVELPFMDRENLEKLQKVLKNMKITDKMIDFVQNSNATDVVKDLVLNHLARHGIFDSKEAVSVRSVLIRLLNNKVVPAKFAEVLHLPFSKIKTEAFLSKLNIEIYSKSYLEENCMQEDDIKNQKLCTELQAMTSNTMTGNAFLNGILATIDHISDDTNKYLEENPLILLSMIFVWRQMQTKQASESNDDSPTVNLLGDIFTAEDGLSFSSTVVVPKDIIRNTLEYFPCLKQAVRGEIVSQDANMYELLNGYKNFNAARGFMWRQRTGQMPTFFNEYLVKRYGHKEKLNYVNYLKQGRPNMAARLFMYNQKKFHPDVSSKMKCQASTGAHIFAVRNLDLPEITSACISFIEIIGVDSENLRLHLTAAKRIFDELSISTGELLEAVVYNNAADLNILSSYLDSCFKQRLTETLEEDANELVSAIKDWDLNVRFAQAHKIPLPDTFLVYLIERDLYFEFLLVGQIYAYPVEQMLRLVSKLSNSNIKGHLVACLNKSSLSHGSTINLAERESKSRYPKQYHSKNSTNHHHSDSVCSSDNDLWMTILNCHYSQDPPRSLLRAACSHRSPLLVILATCYEPSSVPAYWCSWLVISTDETGIISDYKDCLDRQVWPADKVMQLIKRLVVLGYTKTLSRGLEIFMPENPLRLFAEFLTQCVNFGDFESGWDKLQAFRAACSHLSSNAKIRWTDTDSTYLKNSYWIALVSVRCVMIALGHSFASTVSQIDFLRTISSCDFGADLPDAPNFKLILKVLEILANSDVTLNFALLSISENWNNLEDELRRCLSELTASENYKDALRLCDAANLDSSYIIIAQWRKDFAKSIGQDGKVDANFWKNCAGDFEKYHLSYEVAAQFYVEHAEKVASHKDRYEILKLAHETLQGTATDTQIIDSVEMAMWKSCFMAGTDNVNLNDEPVVLDKLKTELVSSLRDLQVRCELTEPSEKLGADKLIDKFIDAGDLRTALRIATIFNCKHNDLQVLMLCLSLAEGEITPYQLTAQHQMLLSTKTRLKNQWHMTYRGKGLPRASSMNSLNPNSFGETAEAAAEASTDGAVSVLAKQDKIDCIMQLKKLTEILTHGVAVGQKVLLCYRLAAHLGKTYQTLLTLKDPIQFLEEIVDNECDYKLEVIKDVVAAYKVNNRQLAEFLSAKIVDTVTRHIQEGHVDQPMAMWGYPLDGSFHVVTELCSEPSLLGSKLLEAVTRLLGRSYGENRDVTTLKVIVELLIKAHDCFTTSCNMEGIAAILRKSQQLANSLQNLKQWGLLVRLLTGVGRFTEMNYILQIIKENEQFEFLLTGKGLEKIPGLKTALLDFLKRNCPENKDLFNLVAHHFRLYSEIALMWEQEAKEAINMLLADARIECRNQANPNTGEIRLTKNEGTERRLHLAMINYTHATEYYLQDSKLTLAYQCCHRAELVALQTSFLHSVNQNQQVPCVLNLGSNEIDKMICNDLNFPQANILIRAYNHPVDWGCIIYAHCVIQSDARFLKDFMMTNELTVAIVKDSAKRFQMEKFITKQMAESMQRLISLLKDVECKYTLASQLGFKNVIETILGDSAISSYLKDTVWRKGYTSTAFD